MTSAAILKAIDAQALDNLLKNGKAVLIDIRESDEYIREHIPGSRLVPLSAFNPADFPREHEKIGVFHCHSGNRTQQAATQILATGFREVYYLDGGIEAWKRAGLSLNTNARAPISIMRQVQISAGSLVVLGCLLAVLVSPWFMALSAFVGAGLVFAGATGFCGMAQVLSAMPWNREFRRSATISERPASA
ncbi:rhodanese-like domain-containing protein [Oceanibacterium hippocampi]|uniref:Inner membrane protein YgaP n=1 Tax=Oceanibacterium hippocampi TaxID=745714 RepID=A0A1Y5RXB5_9PROT|nr:rhodanese family protein [Oceanibacterium hippocampi]SLN27480.1 Inner membrane protein YgaP [Oceanibacterium hippocampi]